MGRIRRWTPEEDAQIRSWPEERSIRDLAETLHRDYGTVKRRYWELRGPRHPSAPDAAASPAVALPEVPVSGLNAEPTPDPGPPSEAQEEPPATEESPATPRPTPKRLAWLCHCGQQFPETGSGTGYGRWAQHLSHRGPSCRGEGLIDPTTGEILIFWRGTALLTLQEAMRFGYMPPKEARDALRAREQAARGARAPDARDGASASGGAPRNLEAVVPLERIALPAWVWALKLSTDPILLKEDGSPYGWSAEDKTEWLSDLLQIGWHAVMLQDPARALGLPVEQAEQLVRQGFLDRLLALLKGVPEDQLRHDLEAQLGTRVYRTVVPSTVGGGA